MTASKAPKELKGKHVLMIMLAAFGTIIAANVTMMTSAIRTFPGLVVDNSYVASQQFDQKRVAQEALGWQTEMSLNEGVFTLFFMNEEGVAVYPNEISLKIGRSTTTRDDQTPAMVIKGAGFTAPLSLDDGKWVVDIVAQAADGTEFSQSKSIFVKDGRSI